ncbi:IS3 family transposase [Microbispora bryophytorum]|uniref:IS3 family transposase n=1 Tax=Microbispora bryophytorum TaxID=1460882 RepID=UPI0033D70252
MHALSTRMAVEARRDPDTATGAIKRAAPSERDPQERVDFLRGGARPPLPLIVAYIDEHKHEFGVEPICAVLAGAGTKIAPSTYYAARSRRPSARAVRDEQVTAAITQVHQDNYGVYGIRKVHAALARDGGVASPPASARRWATGH